MALKGQAPIVPVAILGARAAMRKGSPIIYPVTVRIRLGQPIETTGLTLDDRDRLMTNVRDAVAGLLL
jgi:1-acyl-sn-glycerol-3-phosphate acyltransferase